MDNSFNDVDNDMNGYNITTDYSEKNPLDILIEEENQKNVVSDIANILDSGIVSDKQRDQLKMYYFENMTLSQIGKRFGVSREAVRQNIKRAIQLIKNYDKNTNSSLCSNV